jgi:hypothetical protein
MQLISLILLIQGVERGGTGFGHHFFHLQSVKSVVIIYCLLGYPRNEVALGGWVWDIA